MLPLMGEVTMPEVTIEEAVAQLPHLIEQLGNSDCEVVITRDQQPVAKLVGVPKNRPRPRFGSASGQVVIHADFDAPIEDFADYQ
jgi:antitoxin (DNA-binding transcriptional repressor) of toxin-antitoxin stability system